MVQCQGTCGSVHFILHRQLIIRRDRRLYWPTRATPRAISETGRALLVTVLAGILGLQAATSVSQTSLSMAMAIATRTPEARALGTDDLDVEADEANSLWIKFELSAMNYDPVPQDLRKRLRGRSYYAIYVHSRIVPEPGTIITGHGLWVFVEKQTGDISGVWAER